MPKTELGQKVQKWSANAKAEFKADLDKLTKVPPDVMHTVVEKFAKTHPAVNPTELAVSEAEQKEVPDPEALSDALSAFTYIWENIESEAPLAVAEDLMSLEILSSEAYKTLVDLLTSAQPFREAALAASHCIRVGAPLFVSLRGVVDLRLRFHKTEDEFRSGKTPTELVGAQQVVLVNLKLNQLGDESEISFLMDENDLGYMKRFVRNMEKELELSKPLLKSLEPRSNG
jgi:hypothetical protein